MEPEILIRVTPSGNSSVEIHSSSEAEERTALSLYERVKPGIRVLRALLVDALIDVAEQQTGTVSGTGQGDGR